MKSHRPILIAVLVGFGFFAVSIVADGQEAATKKSKPQKDALPKFGANDFEITLPVPGQVVGVYTSTLHIQVKVVGELEDDATSVTAKAIGDNQQEYETSTLERVGSTKYFGGSIQVPASASGKGFRIRADAVFAVGPPGNDVEFDYVGIDLDANRPPEEVGAAHSNVVKTEGLLKATIANKQDNCLTDRIEITRPLKKEKVHVNADGMIFVQLKALDPVKPGSEVRAEAMTYDDPPKAYGVGVLELNEELNLYEGWIVAPHSDSDEGARFLIKGEVDFPDDGKPHRCTYHGPIFGLDK